MRWDYLHKTQVEESVCVYFSFVWFVYVAMYSPRPYTIYIFHTPMAWYSLYVLWVPLNPKQTNSFQALVMLLGHAELHWLSELIVGCNNCWTFLCYYYIITLDICGIWYLCYVWMLIIFVQKAEKSACEEGTGEERTKDFWKWQDGNFCPWGTH